MTKAGAAFPRKEKADMSTGGPFLLNPEQQALLALAGRAIGDALLDQPVFSGKTGRLCHLDEKTGAAWLLGSLVAAEGLAASVHRNAVNAALHDPRFPFFRLPRRI